MKAFSPLRVTAMYHAHLTLGARFSEDHGWTVAEAYTSPDDEEARSRSGVALADVSAGGKLSVRGLGVDALIPNVAGVSAPAARTARRVLLDGAEALVCRRAPDELLLLTSAADEAAVKKQLSRAGEAVGCAHVTDLTSGLAAVDLIGPAAPRLLARLSPLDLSPVEPLGVVQGEVARVPATVIRLDHPDLPAFRLLLSREYGEFCWNTLAEAGEDLGLVPVGAAAHRQLLRAESRSDA